MPRVNANGIQIEYETFGDRSGRPLLLIIGFGGQLIHWTNEVCNDLAEGGHYVIRFDNRDSGLSTRLTNAEVPDPMAAVVAVMQGKAYSPPYDYYDMGDDAASLLDSLGIEKAHICGMSMGAAIAQTVAIKHPSKVASLISIYGSTGDPRLPRMKPEIFELFMAGTLINGRDAFIEYMMEFFRKTRGSGFPFDETWGRRMSAEAYDRSFYPEGLLRQFVAAFGRGNRREALTSVTAPTLVIHGEEDPVIPVECGRDTAAAIPGAELMIIKGMGHDIPYKGAWPQIVKAITAHTSKISI